MRRNFVILLLALVSCTHGQPPVLSSPAGTSSPSPTTEFRFAVIGDWGAGTPDQRAIAQQMCAEKAGTPFSVVVTTGDNFYNPDGTATPRTYNDPERCLLAAHIAWRAVWGNHDIAGRSTASALGAVAHWYRWGARGADFFMLDSNVPGSDAQRAWLAGALAHSRARVKIVVFHHPPYTAGLHTNNTAVQRAWVGLFERYHVTLVLNGHNHDYEHARVHGVDYVVTGGGGATTYACLGRPAYVSICRSVHHFLVVDVTASGLYVRAIDEDGSTFDSFSVAA